MEAGCPHPARPVDEASGIRAARFQGQAGASQLTPVWPSHTKGLHGPVPPHRFHVNGSSQHHHARTLQFTGHLPGTGLSEQRERRGSSRLSPDQPAETTLPGTGPRAEGNPSGPRPAAARPRSTPPPRRRHPRRPASLTRTQDPVRGALRTSSPRSDFSKREAGTV
jgi:hypothetical protein